MGNSKLELTPSFPDTKFSQTTDTKFSSFRLERIDIMPSDRAQDILTIANNHARKRKGAIRLISFAGTRLNKYKKPGNLVKLAAGVAGNFIPTPGLSSISDWIVEKGVETVRGRSHDKKLRKYQQLVEDDPTNKDAVLKELKFEIKTLDIKKLDESLRKLRIQLEKYNAAPVGLSDCHRAFNTAYRYCRTVYRMERLKAQAEILKSACDKVLEFCEELATSLDANYQGMLDDVEKRCDHDQPCAAGAGCYSGQSGRSALEAHAQKVKDEDGVDLP